MVHQIRIDGILQVSPAVVGEEDVDDLAAGVGPVLGVDDLVGEAGDDVGVRVEEGVGLALAQGEGDGLGAKGAADLLEGVEVPGGGVLDEVDVGEAALF